MVTFHKGWGGAVEWQRLRHSMYCASVGKEGGESLCTINSKMLKFPPYTTQFELTELMN